MNYLVFLKIEKNTSKSNSSLAEPIFKSPGTDESRKTKFTVPLGVETWAEQLSLNPFTNQQITEVLANEYLYSQCFKGNECAFQNYYRAQEKY